MKKNVYQRPTTLTPEDTAWKNLNKVATMLNEADTRPNRYYSIKECLQDAERRTMQTTIIAHDPTQKGLFTPDKQWQALYAYEWLMIAHAETDEELAEIAKQVMTTAL